MDRFIKIEITDESGNVYRNYEYAGISPTMGIDSGSMRLDEILCLEELRYGQYNSNKFEVRLFGVDKTLSYALPDMSGARIRVWSESSGNIVVPIFYGTIDSAKKPDRDIYRDVVAYDDMYRVRNIDIGNLWTSYWKSYVTRRVATLQEIRNAVCSFVGLTVTSSQSSTAQPSLPNDTFEFCNTNDNLSTNDTVLPVVPRFSNMSFKDVLSAICELQGCIPNINRQGEIEFIQIARHSATEIIENDNFDTTKTTIDDFMTLESNGFNLYATSETMFYQSQPDSENPYIISGNIFLNTLNLEDIKTLLSELEDTATGLRAGPPNWNIIFTVDWWRPTPEYVSGTLDLIVSDFNVTLGRIVRVPMGSLRWMFVMSISLSGPQLVDEHIESYSYGPTRNPKPSTDNDNLLQNLQYKEQRSKLDSVSGTVESLSRTVLTKNYVAIEVQKLYNNFDVSKVVTSGKSYRFDDSGLNVSDPNSPMSTLITENGMQVRKDGLATLDVNYQGVDAKNLKASTFLLIGDRSRLENYGENRTGCFYVNVNHA